MYEELEKAILPIFGSGKYGNEELLGTAFLIEPNVVLSALHVVFEEARFEKFTLHLHEGLYLYNDSDSDKDSHCVDISGEFIDYNVEQDWVLLRCEKKIGGVSPLLLSIVPDKHSKFEIFGYPPDLQTTPDGITIPGRVINPKAKLRGQQFIQLYSDMLGAEIDLRGLSGSPVICDKKVFGVVKGQLEGKNNEHHHVKAGTIYAIPIESIYSVAKTSLLPQLEFVDLEEERLSHESWIKCLKERERNINFLID